jgi:hypothetical protein
MTMGEPSLQKAPVYDRVKNTEFGLKQGSIAGLISVVVRLYRKQQIHWHT